MTVTNENNRLNEINLQYPIVNESSRHEAAGLFFPFSLRSKKIFSHTHTNHPSINQSSSGPSFSHSYLTARTRGLRRAFCQGQRFFSQKSNESTMNQNQSETQSPTQERDGRNNHCVWAANTHGKTYAALNSSSGQSRALSFHSTSGLLPLTNMIFYHAYY